MGFTIIAERVEFESLAYERRSEVLTEIRKNSLIHEFLSDLEKSLPVGDHYSEEQILAECVRVGQRNNNENVTVGEAYSALVMELEDRAEEIEAARENVERFKCAFKNLDEVDLSES